MTWNGSVALNDAAFDVAELKRKDGPSLLTQGSTELIQTLLANELVDEINIFSFPVVLGRGKKLFGGGPKPAAFRLISGRISPNGILIANYVRDGEWFTNFAPGVSNKVARAIRQTMRSWTLKRRTDKSLDDFARMFNPVIRGWINYYGSYYKSALYPTFQYFDFMLSKWASRKYRRLKGRQRRAWRWLRRIMQRQPDLFAHWDLLYSWAGR